MEDTWIRALSTTFTISKLVEWIDTAFIIWLGNNPPIFLHTYHHATTFWLFCMVMNMPGTEKFGLMMNGFVHTLMYSHYWRSWGKTPLKPLIPVITVLQIIQLATVTYTWTVNPYECGANSRYSTAPTTFLPEFLTPYAMVPVFLYYFLKYFVGRFILKSSPKSKPSKASAADAAAKASKTE